MRAGRLVALALLGLAAPAAADEAAVRRHVETLASEAFEGRLTGSPGEERAAAYLEDELERLGARPLPGHEGFRVPFEFSAGAADDGSTLTVPGEGDEDGARHFSGSADVQALSFSDNGEVAGEVVFAGYGLSVPEGQGLGYDSFAGLDITGKVVLVLRYFPEDASPEVRSVLARHSGLRYKALHARRLGAAALLVVTGPRSPNAGETVPMTFDAAISGSGLPAASVSGQVAEALFAGSGRSLEEAQRDLDDANPHVAGFPLAAGPVRLAVRVEREVRTGYNVVGLLPGTGTAGMPKPYVLVGAHYDHLGRGRHGNSLARQEEEGQVHYGADDNASGVAAVLEIGRALAEEERGRGVVLAFWSGEELGLLGSTDFLKREVLPAAEVAACLNFDMVGRVRDNRLVLQAAGSSGVWPRLVEAGNVPVGLEVELQNDPYLPTDAASCYQAEVPTLNFFSGSHEDYHRPSDRPAGVNFTDLARVARLGARVTARLSALPEAPDYRTVERQAQAAGDRDTLRAFTGTIPDYTTEVEGLRLSGVIGGGPAEEAGLREGDVIVEFAGLPITNIYDYTYALDVVKIGEPVQVSFLRDGQRMEATVVPRARK